MFKKADDADELVFDDLRVTGDGIFYLDIMVETDYPLV